MNEFSKKYYIDNARLDKSLSQGWLVEKNLRISSEERDFALVRESVPCQNGCPAKTNIPGYIRTLYEKRYGRSYELNRFVNIFPGILGRICSRPCEKECRHGWEGLGEPVAICNLKRAAADLKNKGYRISEQLFASSEKKVAIIGAGPAGLTAAHDLAKLGHSIDLFEAKSAPGGMLKYGIPRFRLPQDIIDEDFNYLFRLGINLHTNCELGKNLDLEMLLRDYEAVLLAIGCSESNRLNIPGENLEGVFSALRFMEDFNEGKELKVGKKSYIIGGGFTAMDCVRSTVRIGASSVFLNINTTERYLTIPREEIFHIKEERIQINSLYDVQEFIGENGKLKALRFKKARIERIDENGMAVISLIDGSDFTVEADSAIVAIGQHRNYTGLKPVTDSKNRPAVKENWSSLENEKLFFCGDFYSGPSTVIEAIAHSRQVVSKIDEFLTKKIRKKWMVMTTPSPKSDRTRDMDFRKREEMELEPLDNRTGKKFLEVEKGYTAENAEQEAGRCYLCYLNYEIRAEECIYCFACIDVAPRNCIKKIKEIKKEENGNYTFVEAKKWQEVNAIVIDNKECIRCSACYNICPVNCIQVSKSELIDMDIEK